MNRREHMEVFGELVEAIWIRLQDIVLPIADFVQLKDISMEDRAPGAPEFGFLLDPTNPESASVEVMPDSGSSVFITIDEWTTVDLLWREDLVGRVLEETVEIVQAVVDGRFQEVRWLASNGSVLDRVGYIMDTANGSWHPVGSVGSLTSPVRRAVGRRTEKRFAPYSPK